MRARRCIYVKGVALRNRTFESEERLVTYAKEIIQQLRNEQVRVESELGPDLIKAKIAEAEKARVHTMLVIGGRDMDAGAVSVRLHSKGPQGAKPKGEVVAEILAAIKERRAGKSPFVRFFCPGGGGRGGRGGST